MTLKRFSSTHRSFGIKALFLALFMMCAVFTTSAQACETASEAENQLEELSEGIIERFDAFVEDVTNFIYDDLRLTATTEAMDRLDEYNTNLYPEINHWWKILGSEQISRVINPNNTNNTNNNTSTTLTFDYVFGDSIANGLQGASGLPGHTQPGASTQTILNNVMGYGATSLTGQNILLTVGINNSGLQAFQTYGPSILSYLQSVGVTNIVVMGINDTYMVPGSSATAAEKNAAIEQVTTAAGEIFGGSYGSANTTDGHHLNSTGYQNLYQQAVTALQTYGQQQPNNGTNNTVSQNSNVQNTYDGSQLQRFTAQMSLSKIAQTMHLGMLIDAQILQEVIQEKQKQRVEGLRRGRMDDMVCQVDSAPRTQTKAFKTARGLARAWAVEDNKRTGNFAGSISENGTNAEKAFLWQDYTSKFCDPAMGDQGCTTAGTHPGGQTDIAGDLWQEKQTIDMTDEENRNRLLAAQQTLVTPFSPDPINAKVLKSATGQEIFMKRRAKIARINTVYNVVGQLLGERAPGDQNDYIKQIRQKAGAPADTISNNPSYSEMRDTMARTRYMDPEYFAHLAGPPENVMREQNVIGAIRLQQMNDYYKRSEEFLALEAAQYADELDAMGLPPSAVPDAPLN